MCAFNAYAQTDTIRYVHPDGDFGNDGKSWAKAMPKLQEAINDLRDYMIRYKRHPAVVREHLGLGLCGGRNVCPDGSDGVKRRFDAQYVL